MEGGPGLTPRCLQSELHCGSLSVFEEIFLFCFYCSGQGFFFLRIVCGMLHLKSLVARKRWCCQISGFHVRIAHFLPTEYSMSVTVASTIQQADVGWSSQCSPRRVAL